MNIVITGGSRGIGRCIVEKLHKDHTCFILARESEALRETSTALHCIALPCDVTKAQEVDATIKRIESDHGPIDVLINNAGIWIEGPLETNTYEEIERAIQTNVLGVIYPTRAALTGMKARKHGQIINISSQSGLKSRTDRSIYNASKWAVTGFTKCLQDELGPMNIRVTGIYPGTVNTGFFARNGNSEKDLSKAIPPEDVASAVIWIISQPANFLIPDLGIREISK